MIGGPPMMMPPGMASGVPVRQQQARLPAVQQQPRAGAAPTRPVVRAQTPDEQQPPTYPARLPELTAIKAPNLTIPSPEQLGIGRTTPPEVFDLASARSRLDRIGAIYSHVEKATPNNYRFICLLPTATATRNHRVEAVAASEAEAVQLVVEKCEQWAGGR